MGGGGFRSWFHELVSVFLCHVSTTSQLQNRTLLSHSSLHGSYSQLVVVSVDIDIESIDGFICTLQVD